MRILSSSKKHEQNKRAGFWHKLLRRIYLDCYSLQVFWFTLVNLKCIAIEKPDIVIPTNGGWQTLIIIVIRRIGLIGRCKIVIIGHAGIGHDDEFNLRYGGADVFVTLTREAEFWAKKIKPDANIVYISNGVDCEQFSFTGDKHDYHLPRPIFLTCASFEKYKNIDKTIEAVSELPKGSLVIIGMGEEEKRLHLLCEEKLNARFLMLSVNHVKMPGYYRGADVFTLVSGEQEAFGLVYLEAMACGKPVVATDDTKRREIVGEAGIFVDADDLEVYKTALMKAAIINWGDKPRLQAEKFSWEAIGERYDRVLSNTNQ